MKKNFYPAMLLLAGCVAYPFGFQANAHPIGGNSKSDSSRPETGVCTGTVLDEQDEPLIGASIIVEGTQLGASTNLNGQFSIAKVAVGSKIKISYVGYNPVTVEWSGTPLEIKMEPNSSALDEVVVIGFGVQKKSDLTGSVSQVSMDKVLGDRPVINAAAALQVPSPAS